jgi:diguanylate cyclase (GGDEF)-like protein/PAS domain S-box-containing protein
MNRLLRPAIRAMDKLNYSRKFALHGSLFVAATAIVVLELIGLLTVTLGKLAEERLGNALIVKISQTVRNVQQHRGMSAAVLGGNERMSEARAAKEREVEASFDLMLEALRLSRASVVDVDKLAKLWQQIRTEGQGWSVAKSFKSHSDLVGLMLDQLITMADLYGLQLDEDVGTHYLIDVAVSELPSVLEGLGKIRAHGTGMIAQRDVSEAQHFQLLYLIADFQSTLKSMQNHLTRVRQHNSAYDARLMRSAVVIDAASSDFTAVATQQMLDRMFSLTPEAYFARVTQSIDVIYGELFETFHPVVDDMLRDRYRRTLQKTAIVVGLVLLLLLALGYVALGAYLAVMHNIRHLVDSLQAFATGDHQRRVKLNTGDEMRLIGDHFNTMADEIEGLIEANHQDLLHQKRLNSQLQLAGRVFDAAHEGISVTDIYGTILQVNPAFCEITGYVSDELVGKTHAALQAERGDAPDPVVLRRTLEQTGEWHGEIWNRKKDGSDYAVMMSISALRDDDDQVRQYVCLLTDITESKVYQERLEQQAHHDALTGLPNRILLSDRIQQAVVRARRTGEVIGVVGLDLDGFKTVNDGHGHDAGDHLLIEIGKRLQASVRTNDTVARLGGDEFVLILADVTGQEDCERTLARVLAHIALPVRLVSGQVARVSGSIGYTLFPEDDAAPDTLLRHADLAMYVAKQSGKNRFTRFDVRQDQRQRGNATVLNRMEKGLLRGEFELYVQPKVNSLNGGVIGAEALIRWNHPVRGLIPPGEFLPLISDKPSLCLAFDAWVLQEGVRILQAWQQVGLDVPLSLNMSSHQLQQQDFGQKIADALAAAPDLKPDRLEIEIIESAALDDLQRVVQLIAQCQAIGVRFALDDFGTGYSTLTYLKQMSVDTLKIDSSFVRDMEDDANSMAIVQGIIALADAFKCDVVAEGVETWSQAQSLLKRGCQHIQGYVVARPMPAQAMVTWVGQFKCPVMTEVKV